MQLSKDSQLKRIGIFYDGTFFSKVSQYYRYQDARRSHLSFTGIHEFVRRVVSENASHPFPDCQVVDAHFFRGRFSLTAAKAANALESDRFVDQLLMYAGIVTHYYPMNEQVSPPEEKGIDVWLSLEAYDLAMHKHFDVMVLVAGDQDFVPLVRKLHGIGIQVMVLAFDLRYTDQHGNARWITTSQALQNEASFPIMMSETIAEDAEDPLVKKLFAP